MEEFSFVLLASIVGIALVFIFLALLSLLMVLIRNVDRIDAGRGKTDEQAHDGARQKPAGAGTASAAPPPVPALPVWAIAAVSAYLDAEREIDRASASVWTARASR